MSKNKVLFCISERIYEYLGSLSVSAYVFKMKNQYFCFETYFESIYKEIITYSLEYLEIKDIENYKELYHKYFLEVNNMSEKNAISYTSIDVSNKKDFFEYWKNKRLDFLQEILDISKKE